MQEPQEAQEKQIITYERWFSVAVGGMSMRPEDFNSLTPAEFIYAWQGYTERQTTQFRSEWERTRYQTWILCSIQFDRKDRKPMTEMFPLPWEEVQQPTQLTEPTMQERADRVHEILNQLKR